MRDSQGHAARNAARFDAWAPTYEDKRFDFFRRLQKRVLSLLEVRDGSTLLDIGCGTGWAVRAAAGMVGSAGRACGIDVSPGMIEKATRAAQGVGNARFQVANSEELPFESDSFDFIMCTMSFHHYLDPGKAVGEMARVLKPGGTVCIVDPTADSFIFTWADEVMKRREPEHVKLYSTREFIQFFEGAGLRHVASRGVMFPWLTAKGHFAVK
jgi:ubiquinone/menaquinone biosynthesis C-methylase UbiE